MARKSGNTVIRESSVWSIRGLASILLLLSTLLPALSACGGSSGPVATQSPGQGGITPPMYEEPVLLTEGDYLPADFPFDQVADRGQALAAADAQKPTFEGTVAGVRLYSVARAFADPSIEKKRCVVEGFREAEGLDFAYLPGGTYANGPQFAGVCAGGEIALIMQQFTTKHGSFDIIFEYGEAALGHDAPAHRVEEVTIGGRKAVVISPVVEEGFGRGWAAYATPKGILIVDGRDLPTDELIKILGGVECSVC